jgi:hypothetical protein
LTVGWCSDILKSIHSINHNKPHKKWLSHKKIPRE